MNGPLHTVNKSPYASTALEKCLDRIEDGAVLLIEDGVVGALAANPLAARLAGRVVYVLGPDLTARGLDALARLDSVRVIDHAMFVALAVRHSSVVAWR